MSEAGPCSTVSQDKDLAQSPLPTLQSIFEPWFQSSKPLGTDCTEWIVSGSRVLSQRPLVPTHQMETGRWQEALGCWGQAPGGGQSSLQTRIRGDFLGTFYMEGKTEPSRNPRAMDPSSLASVREGWWCADRAWASWSTMHRARPRTRVPGR